MINDRYITLTRHHEEGVIHIRKSDITAIGEGPTYRVIYAKDWVFHVNESADAIRLRIAGRA